MKELLIWLDPIFVYPFRLIAQPEAAYILGTAVWALCCAILGVLTIRFARRLHAKRLQKLVEDMRHYHKLGEAALACGEKDTFKAVNRQAHEAFGYHFSLSGAFFVASLWPVPVVLAWMQLRFGDIGPVLPFDLPLFGNCPNLIFWFVILYIPLRMCCTRWLPHKPREVEEALLTK